MAHQPSAGPGRAGGRRGREGPSERRGRVGTGDRESLLKWEDPRGKVSHFVEGQERLEFEGGMISSGENARRLAAIKAQQSDWAAQFKLREKIKPIKDPDDVTDARRTAAKRKKRSGTRLATTTLSQSLDTLG